MGMGDGRGVLHVTGWRPVMRCFFAVLLILAIPAASAPAAQSTTFKLANICPPPGVRIPRPWSVREAGVRPDLGYSTPHFSAPFSAFGVSPKSANPNAQNVFVSLRICVPRSDAAYYQGPCGQIAAMQEATTRGSGYRRVLKNVAGLNVGYRSRFWPDSREYLGMCDELDFNTMRAGPWSLCHIWMPDKSLKRGIYVVVPGSAFSQIPRVMIEAGVFLAPKFSPCAI
jgi:hypothetical protein